MVKTRFLFLLASVILFAGCGLLSRSERANPEVLQIATARLGSEASLVRSGDRLVVVYSDWETTGLYEVEVPITDHLPTVAPAANMIDKIDIALPVSSAFGEHVVAARGNTITVMYLARAFEDKMILKIASRDSGAPAWTLDALEPPGDPIAILPLGSDRLDLFWAAGNLLHMAYPRAGQAESLLDPFTPAERAGAFGASTSADSGTDAGMTVYDSISRSLLVFRWNGSTYDHVKMDGTGPISSSLLLPDGSLAVLSWDPATRRLELLVLGRGDSKVSRSLVTLSEGTAKVALLPPAESEGPPGNARTPARIDRLLFLYDDARRLGGGRVLHELCLLAPGSGWIPVSRKYRKVVLTSSPDPITDFSAVEAAGRLYVLVRQGGLRLLGLSLPR